MLHCTKIDIFVEKSYVMYNCLFFSGFGGGGFGPGGPGGFRPFYRFHRG